MRVLEEELAVKEEHWLQKEARLQGVVSSLQRELQQEREQHSQEVQLLLSLPILSSIVIVAVPVVVVLFISSRL